MGNRWTQSGVEQTITLTGNTGAGNKVSETREDSYYKIKADMENRTKT